MSRESEQSTPMARCQKCGNRLIVRKTRSAGLATRRWKRCTCCGAERITIECDDPAGLPAISHPLTTVATHTLRT
jgi:hypothetical protein